MDRNIKRPIDVPCKEHWPHMGEGCKKCSVMELEDWARERVKDNG